MERQSNMELLRLVAMMMILVMHMDYGAFGLPTAEGVEQAPMTTFGRIFVEHLCLVAVNVYVLISGWFGIRPKMKSFVRLMLQVAMYSIIITGAFLLLGKTTFKIGYVTDMLIIGKQYWFVVSYLLLYLVSPILNTFVEHSSKREFQWMLLVFFGFQFVYSWIFGLEEFAGGYSALSFMGLYLLARYVKIYENDNERRRTKDNNQDNHPDGIASRFTLHASRFTFSQLLALYLFIAAITALFVFLAYGWKGNSFGDACAGIFAHYNSPFIVVSSLVVLLMFSKLEFQSKVINYLSSSAFAVYLIHAHPLLWDEYLNLFPPIYAKYPNLLGVLLMMLVAVIIF
ncbi:MAG: acyltransferase family protein, partial [Bacteroidaceae bacterium]|nr:acyltransferase family protein [Bacteroidaceae bacterium]